MTHIVRRPPTGCENIPKIAVSLNKSILSASPRRKNTCYSAYRFTHLQADTTQEEIELEISNSPELMAAGWLIKALN